MHRHFHHHPFGRPDGQAPVRVALPLAEHPYLEFEADFAVLSVVPLLPGEEAFCEVGGIITERDVDVKAQNGTTRLRVSGAARAIEDRFDRGRGRPWDASFWEKHRGPNRFPIQIVLHVPAAVRARVRSTAARINVERLVGCDLTIATDAGALQLDDVSGRLELSTDAGRIDGRGLSGAIDASTSAGTIRLEIRSLDPGTHRVRTNMGAARVELAEGMPVQVDTRTSMGSARVDFRSIKGARSVLEVEADLGAIRVMTSRAAWVPSASPVPSPAAPSPVDGSTPYRTSGDTKATSVDLDVEIEKVLERVANGTLSPNDARELLRAMGWG